MEDVGRSARRSDRRNASGQRQGVFRGLAIVVLLGAGPISSATPASAPPSGLVLEDFFRGQLDGMGTERDSQHATARGVSFSGKGVGIPGGIRLSYDVVFSDGERQHKVWTFMKAGEGHYIGLRDDVIGTADITQTGNDILMSYTARVTTKSGLHNLSFSEEFRRTAPGTLVNTFKATYLFFTVASGQVTIQKIRH